MAQDLSARDSRARYRRIVRFAARVGAQTLWYESVLPRIGLRRVADRTRARRIRRTARRFHDLAIELGGLLIKVGQFMSSRLDVLPPEIVHELEGLQDEVPAVPFPAIKEAAELELGLPLEQVFEYFDPTPVAAASLGQVHRARLTALDAADFGLREVAVKVQRPGIDGIVEVDLAALRVIAQRLRRVRVVANRVDPVALVEEFATTSLQEIDYLHEATSAERFRENSAQNPRVGVPEIVWERSTRRVLTMEDVTAIKISDVDALRAAGIDPVEVAEALAGAMFDQIFTDSFFHADPHPGNIFVTPLPAGEPVPWQLTFIDFGMMGEISESTRDGLRKLLIAVASRDSKGLVSAIEEVGMLLPSAGTAELERAMTELFKRFSGMGLAELRKVDPREFQDFADEFGDVVRNLPFQLPEHFLLLIRAVSVTSGVCSGLDPKFNVWDVVEPYVTQLVRDEAGNLLTSFASQAGQVAKTVWGLPQRVDRLITQIEDGRVSFDVSHLDRRLARLERLGRRVLAAVVFAGLLIAGALLRPDSAALGTVLMDTSALPLVYALPPRRGPRHHHRR
ncbi:AarF/ABC1/UbiB kinase family protein [Rarobacter faecitabidus]|nr:AarF/UbiB family protein [Rarobacter faecitabidus]